MSFLFSLLLSVFYHSFLPLLRCLCYAASVTLRLSLCVCHSIAEDTSRDRITLIKGCIAMPTAVTRLGFKSITLDGVFIADRVRRQQVRGSPVPMVYRPSVKEEFQGYQLADEYIYKNRFEPVIVKLGNKQVYIPIRTTIFRQSANPGTIAAIVYCHWQRLSASLQLSFLGQRGLRYTILSLGFDEKIDSL